MLRWGLVPSWAADMKIGHKMINARSETVASRVAFRFAFQRRRCLTCADGFYEWRKLPSGRRQPYRVVLKDERPFAFAGLWETWRSLEGEKVESCTIIVTDANDLLRPIHDRMPVILGPENFDAWLGPTAPSEEIQKLLRPFPDELLMLYPVSERVNRPDNDDPECIAPLVD